MVRNFLFHRVNPQREELWDPMDVGLFNKCITYIFKNYSIVQLEELFFESSQLKSKKKFATILFDDGYKDNIEYAASILDKNRIKASFYVVTDCIEKNVPTWTYILDYAFLHTRKSKIDLFYDFLPVELRIKELKDNKARVEYVRKLKPAIKQLHHVNRDEIMRTIISTYDDIELPKLMNWNDLQELKNAGHYIGSHTITHCMLGTMTNEHDVKRELLESGATIEKRLGHFPLTISYPVGSYNHTTTRLSREVGYKIGLAVKQKIYNPKFDSDFEIPRI
jgi:peptidoglycan/xylan/chitin deacetylase (PgdA/CDA1 family)